MQLFFELLAKKEASNKGSEIFLSGGRGGRGEGGREGEAGAEEEELSAGGGESCWQEEGQQ